MDPGHQQDDKMQPRTQLSYGLWGYHRDIIINIDLSCGTISGTDMVLSSSLGLNVTMAPDDSKNHPDQYGCSGSMCCEPDLGPKKQPSPLESA